MIRRMLAWLAELAAALRDEDSVPDRIPKCEPGWCVHDRGRCIKCGFPSDMYQAL